MLMNRMPRNRRWVNFILVCTLCAATVAAELGSDVFPADRIIDWTGVGVEGGIPERPMQRDCKLSDGATGDGVSDDTAAIKTCLSNTPAGQTAFLPTGTYIVSANIEIPSQKTLRGAGPDQTIILANSPYKIIMSIGHQYGYDTAIDIISGFTRGSDQLKFSSAEEISSILVSDYLRVDELNDGSIPVTINGGFGDCTWCGRDNGARVRGQFVKVTAKSGSSITIDPPMFFTFTPSLKPQVQRIKEMTENAGLERLTIKNGAGGYTDQRINLEITYTADSWVKDVRIDTCGRRCISMPFNNYHAEIRDSLITECINHLDSDNCYGIGIGSYHTGCLFENNIFYKTSDGPMLAWGASGNVVAYNYHLDVQRTQNDRTWFWGDMNTHGAHTAYNLWEGNVGAGYGVDDYWGSHSFNVLFRNRVTAKNPLKAYGTNVGMVGAIQMDKECRYMSVVGNVLGTAGWTTAYQHEGEDFNAYEKTIYKLGYYSNGDSDAAGNDHAVFTTLFRHMNFDYATNSVKHCDDAGEPGCQGGPAGTTLPASLYRESPPSWWGTTPWPAIGPDVAGYENKIPAQLRFEAQNASQSCAERGGSCCSIGQTCNGTVPAATDCQSCCIGACVQYHEADTDRDGCIEITEVQTYINRWRQSSADVTISELLAAIRLWKMDCQKV
jgi:hypothetical protein